MVTHKKTKKRRILMMKMKKIVAKEISNRASEGKQLNDSKTMHNQ